MESFKVMGEIKEMAVSQRQMSAALGLSTTRINQLLQEGMLVRDKSRTNGQLMLFDSLKNYFLSKRTGEDGEELNYTMERARLTKAKRELAELKLGRAKGELLEATKVEESFTGLLTTLRKNLTALPSKMARQLSGKSESEINRILAEEIDYALEELSNYDLGELKTEVAIYDED